MDVLLLIPAFNERDSIGAVITRAKAAGFDDILVVDDGSTDGTSGICRQHGVRVLRNKRQLGVGATVKNGLLHAARLGPNFIVIIDADGEYYPEDIKDILLGMDAADLVLGSRFLNGLPRMRLLNRIGNLFFTSLTSLFSGQRLTDTQTGLRAVRVSALSCISLNGGYTYTQEMVISAAKKGLRISEVPVRYTLRKHGCSKVVRNPFLYGMRVLPIVFRAFFGK